VSGQRSLSPLRVAAAIGSVLALLVVLVVGAAAGVVGAATGFLGGSSRSGLAAGRQQANGWPWGQCTWYVAAERAQMGEPVTWGGDAWQWLANAAAQGRPETSIPAPGEIAVYGRGGSYDPRYGHVAVVIAVGPSGYTVSEANFYGLGVIDMRSISWPDPQTAGFIG
jgi:surface antigen